MNEMGRVLVYGANGHTGRFVVDELLRRGLTPVLSGRSAPALEALARAHGGLEWRSWPLADGAPPPALDDIDVVVNCAGPFLDTALPVATAAVAAGAHYLDVTAEQAAVQAVYRELADPARSAGVGVVPAMAFYGGLADLLATVATGGSAHDSAPVDEITVAIALDRWWPTEGTRATGRRNTVRRLVVNDGRLAPLAEPAPESTWRFPEPFGEQRMVGLPFSEVVTIARHLPVGDLTSYLNTASLSDLRDPATPAPVATDESGRSAQRFAVEVVVRRGGQERRIAASGRDIYAVTAPIVVEGVVRLLTGRTLTTGVAAPGEIFDAGEVLAVLAAGPLRIAVGDTSAV
ncbi:saccharopine dehydrogenase NADP-binding domain-containing protein [Micromonospora sp. WMMD558]|uniref:saccharopine dehydrogenase NADP-binding domain-containing protein n=1 Tax=unclassified Micromonospora TaxID=2617518 RepID=UPI0012B4D8B4|nr:saccharopine dehydrogenase NADP-binding domain-containing protein [Micromonospora sp. WMMC415]QGN50502.1 saccharopine dehydrogenase [Micromonospora sp. WMMC415]